MLKGFTYELVHKMTSKTHCSIWWFDNWAKRKYALVNIKVHRRSSRHCDLNQQVSSILICNRDCDCMNILVFLEQHGANTISCLFHTAQQKAFFFYWLCAGSSLVTAASFSAVLAILFVWEPGDLGDCPSFVATRLSSPPDNRLRGAQQGTEAPPPPPASRTAPRLL